MRIGVEDSAGLTRDHEDVIGSAVGGSGGEEVVTEAELTGVVPQDGHIGFAIAHDGLVIESLRPTWGEGSQKVSMRVIDVRQERVRRGCRLYSVGSGKCAEIVVEGVILEHHDDDVGDRRVRRSPGARSRDWVSYSSSVEGSRSKSASGQRAGSEDLDGSAP